MKAALVLSGGGARAAYQVGVLKAVSEILSQSSQITSPFQIICGTSAGAINAAKLATEVDNFAESVNSLYQIWSTITSQDVHRSGYGELLKSTSVLFGSFFHRGRSGARPLSLFDNKPLLQLLKKNIKMERLSQMIDSKMLHALCISASGYSSGQNISFFQGDASLTPWKSALKLGVKTELNHNHLLASSALPAIFPAVRINREYFGDGALRQTAPLSSALNLGADKLFVIGVSGNAKLTDDRITTNDSPTLAKIMSQLFNSAFIDALEEDIGLIKRFNNFISFLSEQQQRSMKVRPVQLLVIEPTIKFDVVANDNIYCLPRSLRWLLKTVGATQGGDGTSLVSYLLFEKQYCIQLMEHGYQDGLSQADDICKFFI